jgi:hypothetical protein
VNVGTRAKEKERPKGNGLPRIARRAKYSVALRQAPTCGSEVTWSMAARLSSKSGVAGTLLRGRATWTRRGHSDGSTLQEQAGRGSTMARRGDLRRQPAGKDATARPHGRPRSILAASMTRKVTTDLTKFSTAMVRLLSLPKRRRRPAYTIRKTRETACRRCIGLSSTPIAARQSPRPVLEQRAALANRRRSVAWPAREQVPSSDRHSCAFPGQGDVTAERLSEGHTSTGSPRCSSRAGRVCS